MYLNYDYENELVREVNVNRKYKDNIFTDLFSDKQRSFELYKSLHPEDDDVCVDDVVNITLDPSIINDVVNDLGLLVKNRMLILMEAQSSWSDNILLRLLIYLGRSIDLYLSKNELDLHQRKALKLPEIELFVVYTGEKKNIEQVLDFKKIHYGGKEQAIDIRARVVYDSSEGNILSQYIGFCKIMDECLHHDNSLDSALRGIEECIKQGILADYLRIKKAEVAAVMKALYTREEYEKIHEKALRQQAYEDALEQAREVAREEVREEVCDAVEIKTYVGLVNKGKLSVSEVSEEMGISVEEFIAKAKKYGYEIK